MSGSDPRRAADDRQDPNRTVGGARQRWGPFWIDEPTWFWVAAVLLLLLAVGLFALAVGFDPP